MEEKKENVRVPLTDDQIEGISAGSFEEINQLASAMGMETRPATDFCTRDKLGALTDYVVSIVEELKKYHIVGSNTLIQTVGSNSYRDLNGNELTHQQVLDCITAARTPQSYVPRGPR